MTGTLSFLFIACFAAATLLPGGSEALLLAMVAQESTPVLLLWLVATLGNSLGSMSSYLLGYWGRSIGPVTEPTRRYRRAVVWLDKYGHWSLIMSWLPVVGDLLCLLAGWRKFPLLASCVLILVGKSVRYGALLWLYFYFS